MGIKEEHNAKTEEIVISGCSGRFPNSDDVKMFKENLLNGNDLVTDTKHPVIKRTGKLRNHKHFDSTFFKIHARQADAMDPQARMLLEVTYEAIIDAGVNPEEIRGSKTGVFVGSHLSEAQECWSSENKDYTVTGCSRSMVANWVSYAFDFLGPSLSVDTACSSSLLALQQAFDAIRSGQCDFAIAAGVNLMLNPGTTTQFAKLGILSPDGKCKSFDASVNGFVRSEAVVAIFLQKSSEAKRVYATVSAVSSNCDGYTQEGITCPNSKAQATLIKEVYEKFGIDKSEVVFVEAHGTGTAVGDCQELNAIVDVFCENRRKEALMIGSVKSVMGHSEAASGLCSVVKMLIAMESGIIPVNLHYDTPNPNIPALTDGRLKVVTKNQKWNGGKVAVNSFGLGGTNVHVVLSSNQKSKTRVTSRALQIPRLIAMSGRTEEAVNYIIDALKSEPYNEEFYALINEIHKKNIPEHNFRGFCVLSKNEPFNRLRSVETSKPQIWFIFTGMGCIYPGMGKDLMKLWPLKQSIESSADVLKKCNIDLIDAIITTEGLINSFVALIAIQLALIDLMNVLNIKPDGFIGHSVGEISCAYADGAITREQAILLAYHRGISSVKSNPPAGKMASVGITKEDFKKRAPPDISIACYNSSNNLTISGPPESINKFTRNLREGGIFAKEVDTFGVAFHSEYISTIAPVLRKSLEGLIENPKRRSSKWVSTSVVENTGDGLCTAEYFVNNLLSPVYFHEATKRIPEDAVVLEIAPHCLLQSVLKKSMPGIKSVGMLKKDCSDNIEFLLSNIGRLYNYGYQPNISALYPPVTYPVSRGTPMLSNLVKWDHSVKWSVPNFTVRNQGKYTCEICLKKEEFQYLKGHNIDGKIIFPLTGYIVLVWKAFAAIKNEDFEKIPIVLEKVEIIRATILPNEGSVKLSVNIFESTGDFEITEDKSLIVKGKIYIPENLDFLKNTDFNHTMDKNINNQRDFGDNKEHTNHKMEAVNSESNGINNNSNNENLSLIKSNHIYKDLNIRGYKYKDAFQGIISSNMQCTQAILKWKNNWVAFMDSMLQLHALGNETRDFSLPTRIQKVAIDPNEHLKMARDEIPVYFNRNCGAIKSPGIEFRGLESKRAARRMEKQRVVLEKYEFVEFEGGDNGVDALNVAMQLVYENNPQVKKFRVVADLNSEEVLMEVKDYFNSEPMLSVDTLTYSYDEIIRKIGELENIHLLILTEGINQIILEEILLKLNTFTFVLFKKDSMMKNTFLDLFAKNKLNILYRNQGYFLARKRKDVANHKTVVIQIKNDPEYNWLPELKQQLKLAEKDEDLKIYLISQGDETSGLPGLLQCLLKELGPRNIRSYLILDKSAPSFSPTCPFYSDQLKKDLVQNVFQNNSWGTLRCLPLEQGNNTNNSEHLYLDILTKGDLSTLTWIESPLKYSQQNFIRISYAGLNFKDVLLASGKLIDDRTSGFRNENDSMLGMEFSGIAQNGKRVMGMSDSKCLATTVDAGLKFIWDVPEEWSLEDAATVPVVYSTVYYSLIIRAKLQPGESVLIHSGCGGVGLAAITLVLHMGCRVFTTVGNQQKREWLLKKFPQLSENHIGNSRDTTFEQMIQNETDGRGVDVVLNSLDGEKLQASVRCLAEFGRFLEIGKADLFDNSDLGMSCFLKGVSFHGILLDMLVKTDRPEAKELWGLVEEGIRGGVVQPLNRQVFPEDEVQEAFRYLGSGKHIGKILIRFKTESKTTNNYLAKSYMNPKKVYVIVGGLGGFGIELIEWLITRGARTIILATKAGIINGYHAFRVKQWEKKGVKIIVSIIDTAIEENAKELIAQANLLGEIGGIFNLAAVLKDALIENQTQDDFKAVCKPKITITQNLDKYSRLYAPGLDYFVCFSSISCGRGTTGQISYGYANSAMENLCNNRRLLRLPALAVEWGAIDDVGIVATTMGNVKEVRGTALQTLSSCLSTLDTLMQQNHPVVSSFVLPTKSKTSEPTAKISLYDKITDIMGNDDYKKIANTTFVNLGMDSLMATEIIQTLDREYDLTLSTKEAKELTFERLKKLETKKNKDLTFEGFEELETENRKELTFEGFHEYEIKKSKTKKYESSKKILMPETTCVRLTSQNNTDTRPIFMVHSIEGKIDNLKNLSSGISFPVYGLQCTESAPLSSIADLAEFYIEEIKKVQKEGPYRLMGYSFGTGVAFEMGTQLEKCGENVSMLLIDGSPEYLNVQGNCCINKHNVLHGFKTTAEINIIRIYLKQFANIDFKQIIEPLAQSKTWDEQVQIVIKSVTSTSKYTADDVRASLNCWSKRLHAGVKYKPSAVFHGKVMLIKSSENFYNIGEDYKLNDICSRKVEIKVAEGTHQSIVDNKKLPSLVNSFFN